MISGERSIRRSVSWIRSSTWPISRRSAESVRLAVSSTLPRASRQPRSRWRRRRTRRRPALRPPSRGNSSPIRPSQRSRLPIGAEDLGGLGQLLGRRASRRLGPADAAPGCRGRPPSGGDSPAARASAISVVRAWRWRISARGRGSAPSAGPPPCPASRPRSRRPASRILSNSSSSSVCVSMAPRRRPADARRQRPGSRRHRVARFVRDAPGGQVATLGRSRRPVRG